MLDTSIYVYVQLFLKPSPRNESKGIFVKWMASKEVGVDCDWILGPWGAQKSMTFREQYVTDISEGTEKNRWEKHIVF